ncbi:DUF58 domain-containing protein [Falsihalocynthiibacter sp. SS001]|uniref:DUF58 domain-containing protein n=1 Tax=Falsihalocynthiibacter sp. SS001 TaxID=3349698 RepID=UPI0036D2E575
MTHAATIQRDRAEGLASALPGLLAAAEQLAASIQLGEHGRRRSGAGDEFWQYRQAVAGDSLRDIDWRRSARSDTHFIRQKEWQAMQSVALWADSSASMRFSSDKNVPHKAYQAQLLTLATAVLLHRGGERISLLGDAEPASASRGALNRFAAALINENPAEFGAPFAKRLQRNTQIVLMSDFLGDPEPLQTLLANAQSHGVRGAMLQVLDPHEVAFPYEGRSVFESPAGTLRHETLKAVGLRDRYKDRLAQRQDMLRSLARSSGWQFSVYQSDTAPLPALLWLYRAVSEGMPC